MYSSWTKGLSVADKKQFVSEVIASQPFINKFIEKMEKDLEASKKNQVTRDYDTPSWSLKQADFIGEQRAFLKVIDLLNNLKYGD
jgi:hypothetical protein